MRAKIGLALLSALVSLLLPTALAAQEEIPPMPLLFQGTVSIDGEPAPAGTNISAEIEEVEVAGPEGVTEAGNYTISIESDDNIGKIVVFKVNGIVAGQHEYVDPWETPTVALNLSIATSGRLLFQGTVSIDGKPAPVGTNISAEIEEVEVAGPEGVTEAGHYAISIEPDDNIGKIVIFKVNGVAAGQHEYVDPWETPIVELDLSIATSGGLSTAWIIAIIAIIAVGIVVSFVTRARRRQS